MCISQGTIGIAQIGQGSGYLRMVFAIVLLLNHQCPLQQCLLLMCISQVTIGISSQCQHSCLGQFKVNCLLTNALQMFNQALCMGYTCTSNSKSLQPMFLPRIVVIYSILHQQYGCWGIFHLCPDYSLHQSMHTEEVLTSSAAHQRVISQHFEHLIHFLFRAHPVGLGNEIHRNVVWVQISTAVEESLCFCWSCLCLGHRQFPGGQHCLRVTFPSAMLLQQLHIEVSIQFHILING